MKVLNKEVELKFGLRAQFIFESITGKTFEVKTTLDQYILFYCCIVAVKDQEIDFNEFIDWCDEHPEALVDFGSFLEDEINKRKIYAEKKSEMTGKE